MASAAANHNISKHRPSIKTQPKSRFFAVDSLSISMAISIPIWISDTSLFDIRLKKYASSRLNS